MAKRKLGLSLVVLIVAAATMVSGTYAWFLTGGFAELFDLGFDVMEASGGIQIKGDATGAEWKNSLEREDFLVSSIIKDGESYKPVSSADGTTFRRVGVEGEYFLSLTPVTAQAEGLNDYNDFKIFARSTTAAPVDALMSIVISEEASMAARVAVTYNGSTTIYALNTETGTTYAVTSAFPETTIRDDGATPRIVDSSDTENAQAGLVSQPLTLLTPEGHVGTTTEGIPLNDIAANDSQSEIGVKIWIEGNDTDCVDVGENAIPGKNLKVKISFRSVD